MARQRQRRRTKADWLEAGLEALESGGVESVRVEGLARPQGVHPELGDVGEDFALVGDALGENDIEGR